ncbi:MAG: HaeIII family restriction endonuclease [Eggerthellaceae bacterium]|nr:HaeIII family restriction endonuclease [Eggerthellaceae bacterium]
MSGIQFDNGRAFEYACVKLFGNQLSALVDVEIHEDEPLINARINYENVSEQMRQQLDDAAAATYYALISLEPTMTESQVFSPVRIRIQSDAQGIAGDVRDIVIGRDNWEIGISCKHNHSAVKHSRLSATIDFGKDWFGFPCSDQYWNEVRPLFSELAKIRDDSGKTALWADDKAERYYVPVLHAFVDELKRLDQQHPGEIPAKLIHYLMGKNDFYKAITNDSHRVTIIEAININGTLAKKTVSTKPLIPLSKLQLPSMLFHVGLVPDSSNKILVAMDKGWQISMRIHNASSKVEPSLKFDVQLEAMPISIHSEVIPWDRIAPRF